MTHLKFTCLAILPLFFFGACKQTSSSSSRIENQKAVKADSVLTDTITDSSTEITEKEAFVLTEENAIDFFFEYQKNLKTTRVKLTTSMGNFTVQLYDNVPYHKANFIYLTKKGYFDNTMFHWVV